MPKKDAQLLQDTKLQQRDKTRERHKTLWEETRVGTRDVKILLRETKNNREMENNNK